MQPPFSLAQALDVEALARSFAETGQVSIEPFIAAGEAEHLYHALRSRTDWLRVINSGDKLFELDHSAERAMPASRRQALDQAVYAAARNNFQFRYQTVRVPDAEAERTISNDPLFRFAEWLSQDPVRALLRAITSDPGIRFADAQATAYSPGDFLTSHDDDVDGKNRSAAYVLSLNPEWRIEWGGLFLMHEHDGGAARALVPRFNRLNLFRVPQRHSVSEVTRATPHRRYSITGWLRR